MADEYDPIDPEVDLDGEDSKASDPDDDQITQEDAWAIISVRNLLCLRSASISSNRELLIPLGLFIGVTLADFLKETTQEFFQSSMQDTSFIKNLLGIGSLFVLSKFISSGLNMQGQTFLSHIGNGGLMQVLWLAKELQQTQNIGNQEKCTSTTDSTSSTVED